MFDWYAPLAPYLVPLQLVTAMLGMGTTMTPADFSCILRDPRGLLLGLLLQWIVVPAVAFTFGVSLGLERGWAVGLLLVAAVPGGALSNLFTYLGRGSTALSIAVTTVTTLSCIATVPLILHLTAGGLLPANFRFPALRIVVEIFAYLLVPLATGMLLRRTLAKHATRLGGWSIRLSVAIVALITIGSLGTGQIRVIEYGFAPPATIVAFGATLTLLVPQLCHAMRRFDDDTVALSTEVAVRNVGIGLLVVRFFFPGEPAQGHVLYTCLFYAGISPLLAAPVLLGHRLRRVAVPLRPRRPRPAQHRP